MNVTDAHGSALPGAGGVGVKAERLNITTGKSDARTHQTTNSENVRESAFRAKSAEQSGSFLHMRGGPTARRRVFLGLFDRRERWSPSSRGWLVFASVLLIGGAVLFRGVYPFLAITDRVDAHVLVVEGWVREYAIRAAVDEFRSGSYEYVVTTGGPVSGIGGYVNDFQTEASVGADLLRKDGIANNFLQMVPSRVMNRDRTYGSAVALRNWFREHHLLVRQINVLTESTHARRTRLLFQKAFGKNVQVGIIAVPNPDYPVNRWWRYSEGVKEVISESAAYAYARFLFYPQLSSPSNKGAAASQASR